MATITTEFGKLSSKGQRAVYLRVRDKKTEKRIATGVKVDESEISPRTKKIKNFEKAQTVEKLRMELMYKMTSIAPEINYSAGMDAARIVSTLVMQEKTESLDFFTFAEDWISKNSLKSTKNYNCTLSALESYLGVRKLDFSQINYTLLKNFELYLSDRPRAKSMYLGYMRHLYREAMLEYNTDEVTVIKNDPFMRYKAPKQVLKKGVRALSVQDILKVYHYKGIDPKGRPQLARDCFILSFCLMGMNSADLYNATVLQKGVVKYNRTKTKDRRSDDAYIEVKVHPFIKQLMKKYAGNTHVFNFYQRYAGFQEMNAALNKGLKEVGKAIGIPKLQFYQARHTFATLSRNMMKFSKSDVDEALNHVGSYDIADVYITKDFSIINENNFKLIEEVFKDEIAGKPKVTAEASEADAKTEAPKAKRPYHRKAKTTTNAKK
jgi:integrase